MKVKIRSGKKSGLMLNIKSDIISTKMLSEFAVDGEEVEVEDSLVFLSEEQIKANVTE